MTIIHKKLPIINSKGVDPAVRPWAGTITNWQIYPNVSDGFTGFGNLTKDLLHRFLDGTDIHTSNIEEFYYSTEDQKGWIITRNTRYELGNIKQGFDFDKFQAQINQF